MFKISKKYNSLKICKRKQTYKIKQQYIIYHREKQVCGSYWVRRVSEFLFYLGRRKTKNTQPNPVQSWIKRERQVYSLIWSFNSD